MNKYIDAVYVITEDNKLVYEINNISVYDNSNSIMLHLKLLCGWDYINPDYNNMQGYCKAENFVDDIQEEIIPMYFINESMTEALNANGYNVLKEIPQTIQKFIDEQNNG